MKVDKIIPGNYEGYVWMSDETAPETLDGSQSYSLELNPDVIPFVIEAQLYDRDAKVSYSVKYIDGEYYVYRWDNVSADMDDDNYTPMTFYANRVGEDIGRKELRLRFLRHWAEEVEKYDDLEIPVLVAKEMIFVGFNK